MFEKNLWPCIYKSVVVRFFFIVALLVSFDISAQDGEITEERIDTVAISSGEEAGANHEIKRKYVDNPVFRQVPDSTVTRMKSEREFAYANDPAYWKKQERVYKKGFWDYLFAFFESNIVRWIFYILVASLFLFVLYRLIVVNDLLIFYSSKKRKPVAVEGAIPIVDPETIDEKIKEAIGANQLQLAVRYLYLKTLYTLNDKNWIQFNAQATNNDYLSQMAQHVRSRDFRFLTRVYDYVWYGEFQISEEQFLLIHDQFKTFNKSI